MNYYNLSREFFSTITGVKDQQILFPENYNRWRDDSFNQIGTYANGKIISFQANIPEMQIKYKAKFLDILGGEVLGDFVSGITLSKQLLEFINNFSLPQHTIYALKLFKIKKNKRNILTNMYVLSYWKRLMNT